MEADEPDFFVMDSQYDKLYDSFDFFKAQALPSTNAPPSYSLNDIHNTRWAASVQSTTAGSTGGPHTSQSSYYGPGRNTGRGIQSLADLFQPNPHPRARKQVTVATLFDDRRIKDGIALCSRLDPSAEHRVKPQFKEDLPEGGEGLWSILECFCTEIDQRLTVDYLPGIFAKPSAQITVITTLLGQNRAFQTLYAKHAKSPLAIALANNTETVDAYGSTVVHTAENLAGWNFSEASSGQDPVMRVVKKDALSFARDRRFFIISHMRSSVPPIMSDRETCGYRLLPSMTGWDGPETRAAQAQKIHSKIYPNFKGVSLGKARKDKALVELYGCASTMATANELVQTVGPANVALGSFRTAKTFEIPWEIIPLAAALVDVEVQTVRNSIHHPSVAREGLFSVLSSFSRGECDRFEHHFNQFKRLRAMPQYANILKKIVQNLNSAHDLGIITQRLLSKAMPQNVNPVS